MPKGENTKATILQTGLELAGQVGLENITIGVLAQRTGLSKSGLFAHFNAKENLQVAILEAAEQDFATSVILPVLKVEAGVSRVRALVERWINWGERLQGGCIFVMTATEFADRPGKVRDCLKRQQEEWIDCLRRIARSAIRVGDFSPDIDVDQFAFDLYSLLLGFHFHHRLLQDERTRQRQEHALNRLLQGFGYNEPGPGNR